MNRRQFSAVALLTVCGGCVRRVYKKPYKPKIERAETSPKQKHIIGIRHYGKMFYCVKTMDGVQLVDIGGHPLYQQVGFDGTGVGRFIYLKGGKCQTGVPQRFPLGTRRGNMVYHKVKPRRT